MNNEEGERREPRRSLMQTSISAVGTAGQLRVLSALCMTIAEILNEVAGDDPDLVPEVRAAIDDVTTLNGRFSAITRVLEAKVDLA